MKLPSIRRNTELLWRALAPGDLGPFSRSRYFSSLEKVQRLSFNVEDGGDAPELVFDLDESAARFLQHLMQVDTLPSSVTIDEHDRFQVRERVAEAFDLLARFDREAPEVVRALIGRVVLARSESSAGGSVGDTLGQVWLAPQCSWDAAKFAECLWHEATHQALFLADMLNRVFAFTRLEADQILITSAIRKTQRPYDLSFHAACVGTALIEMHERLGNHAEAATMAGSLAVTLNEFLEAPHYLTSHGKAILRELAAAARPVAEMTTSDQLQAFEM